MDLVLYLSLLAVGLVLLVKGADWLVEGAASLARKFKVSELAIGLTIVAFGTSAPELIVNSFASYNDHHDIVFGNIIGSNIFNLFVILGIAAIIRPLKVQGSTVWKEIPFSLLAVILLFLLVNDQLLFGKPDILSRGNGVVLLLFFLIFLIYVYRQLKKDPIAEENPHKEMLSSGKIWFYLIVGLTGLILGGKLVVDNAIEIARILDISEKIIGLTIVAAGTSLPEFATSVVAAIKRNNDIAVGNVIGSNIFNILFILSVSSFVKPIGYSPDFNTDLYFLGAGTVFLFISMFTGDKGKLERWEAVILLLAFMAYSLYLFSK